MACTLDNHPEIDELIKLYLPIIVVINSVEELLSRYFTKEKLGPMLYSFIFIYSL